MRDRLGFSTLMLACLVACLTWPAVALAEGTHDRTQFGSDINVGPGETVSEAVCFGCSVRVRGHVESDVTVFGGSVMVEDGGEVGGDIANFGAGVRLQKDTKVGGDVTVFGGQLRREPGSEVGGSLTTFSGGIWIFVIFGLPFIVLGAFVALIVWIVRRLTRPAVPAAA